MNGGMTRAAGHGAIAVLAGLLLSTVSAQAADLGGNCCADLEERVAELEATTARKGNRRVSLTITGQVNRSILLWDDGHDSAAFFGVDNTNTSSRFSFLGEARVSPKWKAGFEIMLETEGTNTSARVNQLNEDGSISNTTYFGLSAGAPPNQGNSDSFFGDARRIAGWIEHSDFGRVTLGRWETAGAVGTIDLGGIGVVTGFGSVSLLNGQFFLRNGDGEFIGTSWGTFLDPSQFQNRQEVLRYDSPTWQGFVFSASISEAAGDFTGTNWGVMLRYAGDHHGFRVAAGIGYEHVGDVFSPAVLVAPGGPAVSVYDFDEPDINAWGGGLSIMHVASGLFLQGSYQAVDYNNADSFPSQYWGDSAVGKRDTDWWQIQGGIAKNWFGLGNTVLYGEYARLNDWGAGIGTGRDFVGTNNFGSMLDVTSSEATVWGIGIVQNIDAAATELYLGYRNFSLDVNSDAICINSEAVTSSCNPEDFNLVTGGMRIRF